MKEKKHYIFPDINFLMFRPLDCAILQSSTALLYTEEIDDNIDWISSDNDDEK